MWRIVVGFVVIVGLALFLLNKGGDIDLGGEKHGAVKPGALLSFVLPAGSRLPLRA